MSPQAEVTAPVVLNAMIEQSSRAAAGQSLLADAHAADEEAAAAAALEAAFPTTAGTDAEGSVGSAVAAAQPQSKKIVFEGDLLAATAVGAVTGTGPPYRLCGHAKNNKYHLIIHLPT